MAHDQVRVDATLVILDSWDSEEIDLRVDGGVVWSQVCSTGNPASCGAQENTCGNEAWADGQVEARGFVLSTAPEITVQFSADLNHPVSDESFGIAEFEVYVR